MIAFIALADKCKKIRLLLPRDPKFKEYGVCLKEIRKMILTRAEKIPAPTTSDYISAVEKIYKVTSQITHEWTGLSPKQVAAEYANRVNNPVYARKSGRGHLVQNNPHERAHGMTLIILPPYYDTCCPTPCEQIAMQTNSRNITVLPEITYLEVSQQKNIRRL